LADGHGKLGGYQIDSMENSDSLVYMARVCRTGGNSKCGDPNKFGVTYRIAHKYDTGSGTDVLIQSRSWATNIKLSNWPLSMLVAIWPVFSSLASEQQVRHF
jgi:hypothetical protein